MASLLSFPSKSPLLRRISSVPSSPHYTICGAGAVGLSLCLFLLIKTSTPPSNITLIDPDLTYARNLACLSAGGVRTALTVPENVAAGLEGLKYYRDGGWVNDVNVVGERHGMGRGDTDVNGDTLQFQEGGYMFLSSTDEGMDSLKHTSRIRQSLGLPPSTIFSDPSSLSSAYPYLNVSDLKGGAVTEGDGWFDPYSFITSTMKLVKTLGVNVITGQVVQAKLEPKGTLTSVEVSPTGVGNATSFDSTLALLKSSCANACIPRHCLLFGHSFQFAFLTVITAAGGSWRTGWRVSAILGALRIFLVYLPVLKFGWFIRRISEASSLELNQT